MVNVGAAQWHGLILRQVKELEGDEEDVPHQEHHAENVPNDPRI